MVLLPGLSPRERLWAWSASSVAWLVALTLLTAGMAAAQDENKAASKPSAPAPALAPDPTPALAPAAPAAGPLTTESAPREGTMLTALLRAHSDPFAAFIGLVLLGLSVYFVAQVIRLGMEFRVKEAVPLTLIDTLETAIKERRFQDAYDACRDDNSFVSRLVRTGVANLPNGRGEAKEAMNTMGEEMVVSMESRITYLATIGTLGPMIGLVGTVWGMIHSFQKIAFAGGSQPRADQVAGGIATALFITLEGVSLSVPAIFFYAYFRNQIAKISMEASKVADRVIAAFWSAAKQPGQTAKV